MRKALLCATAIVALTVSPPGGQAQEVRAGRNVTNAWYRTNDYLHLLDKDGRLWWFQSNWQLVPVPEGLSIRQFGRIGPTPYKRWDYLIEDTEGRLHARVGGVWQLVPLPERATRLVAWEQGLATAGEMRGTIVVVVAMEGRQQAFWRDYPDAGVWHAFNPLP